MKKLDAVIFDFGGVLIDWNPWYLYRKVFMTKVEYNQFMEESKFHQWNERADLGERFSDLMEEVETFAPHWAGHAKIFPERFLETIGGSIEGTVDILSELKRDGVPLYGLTNWSAETFPLAKKAFSFFAKFDDIIVSGEEKMIKPDPRIYNLALQRWGISGKDSLFVDDRIANTQAAEKVGMRALHFVSPERLREDLRAAGYLQID